VTEVAPGVHRVSSGVSNWYLVRDGGAFVAVDAGPAGDWALLAPALASAGGSVGGLVSVILTDAHSDHVGFAERARTAAGAVVRIHTDDEAVAKGATPPRNERGRAPYLFRVELWRTYLGLRKANGLKIVPVHEVATFGDGEVLEVPGRPRVVQVPGHTPGMCALFFESRSTVMTGDALVTRNPLTGRRGPQIAPGGLNRDSAMALASLARLEDLAAGTLLPGHGDPWTGDVREAVRLAREAGSS